MSEPLARPDPDAEYALETAVTCPACEEGITRVQVVRLLRTRVNFTSTLPRRGRIIICPSCRSVLSAELGALS